MHSFYLILMLLTGSSAYPVQSKNFNTVHPVPQEQSVNDTLIPPKITWATYVGGNSGEWLEAIVRDAEGNLYVAGETKSTSGFTLNGYDNVMNQKGKSYLAKYSKDGNKIWATYFGGNPGRDVARALALDPNGNIVMTGFSESYEDDLAFNGFDNEYSGGMSDAFVAKFNSDGNRIWSSYLGGSGDDFGIGITTDQSGNIYVTGMTDSNTGIAVGGPDLSINGYYDAFLTKISPSGQRLWSTYVGGTGGDKGTSLVADAEGNILMTGTTSSASGIALNGSDNILGDAGVTFGPEDAFILKFNSNGVKLWGTYFGGNKNDSGVALALDQDENIYLTGVTYSTTDLAFNAHDLTHNGYYDAYLAKFTSAGQPLWATYLGGDEEEEVEAIAIDKSGNVYIGGLTGSREGLGNNGFMNTYTNEHPYPNGDGFVAAYTTTGQLKWSSYYHSRIFALTTDDEYNLYLGGMTESELLPLHAEDATLGGGEDAFITKVDVSGRIRAGYITGVLYEDSNGNCIYDEQERPLSGIVITTEPSGYFSRTDSLGYYTLLVDTGSYVVKQVLTALQQKILEQTCPVQETNVVIENYYDSAGYNIGNRINNCPQLSVQVIGAEKIRCFRGLTYITYQNAGYTAAENVDLHVRLAEYTHLISADHSYTRDSKGDLVFTLGTLAPQQSGILVLTDSIICQNINILGMTQCTKAWLTPESVCGTPDPAWDKSDISVYGNCLGEGVAKLVLYNHGEGSMTDSAAVRIYADGELSVLMNYKIAKNDSLVLRIPAEGKTIHVEADERPGHPFTLKETAVLEACVTSGGSFSTGFVNTILIGSASPFEATDCQVITGSFDPNDKQVVPAGVTESLYVSPNAQLKYTIRFQNKGTSEAVGIVIVDTLDLNLDVSTLQNITASHPYNFSITGKGKAVLTWRFPSINLPPEEENELLSQGFVSFSIQAKAGMADKTIVENFADIFFDFNDPVRTNTTHISLHDFSETVIPGGLPDELIILPKPDITDVYTGEEEYQLILIGDGFDPNESGNEVIVNDVTGHVDSVRAGKLYVGLPESVAEGTIILTTQAGTDEYVFVITGAEPTVTSRLRIYPNPTKGLLHIEPLPGETIREAFIINSQGGLISVQPKPDMDGDYVVTFSGQPGLYILKVVTDKNSYFHKIIQN